MNILILGGTGAIGSHLVCLLASQGHRVYVTSRREHMDIFNVSYLHGNAHDNVFIQGILKNHYDAIIDFMSYPLSEFTKERVNAFLSSTNQYFFLSSSRVYSNCDGVITEETPRLLDVSKDQKFLSSNEYSLIKAKEENILMDVGKFNWTIVRPYISYSENRLQLGTYELEAWLPRIFNGRAVVLSDDIMSKETTLTYGKDVAMAISKLITTKKSKGEIFNLTTNEHKRWQDILDIYINQYVETTGKTFYFSTTSVSVTCKISNLKYQVLYDRSFNRCFDNKKLLSVCPDLYFTPTNIGLRKCFSKHLTMTHDYNLPVIMEAIQDRAIGARASLKNYTSHKRKLGYLFYRYNPFYNER